MNDFDTRLRARRRKARAANKKILKANAGIARWNRDHPNQLPKEPLDEVMEPGAATFDVDLTPSLRGADIYVARRLPLTEVVDSLRKLAEERGEAGYAFEMAYNAVYSGLSSGGAHSNLFVLDAYLDRPRLFVRVLPRPKVGSVHHNLTQWATALTALLSTRALGAVATVATRTLARYGFKE